MSNDGTNAKCPHVLVVDDDRLILSTLRSGLIHAGYTVSTAESQDDVEALLSSGVRPDLVILDVQLPRSDGLVLAQRLRDFDHIPFIMLSAFSDANKVERAAELGALGYLVKPLDIAQIVPAIEAALARAQELQQLKTTSAQLQQTLDVDRCVSVAVGIVMVQNRLARSAAFEMLRNSARAQRRKLADVAQDLVQSVELHHTP